MDFNNNMPTWSNEGAEPSSTLKTDGFKGGYKPPASVFNWFFSKVSKAITELQTKLSTAESTLSTNKVDKVTGKGLSTNDYTTAEKTKLAGVDTGANKTVVDTAMSNTSTNPVQNKTVYDELGKKVDKATGKGLSTNDYTTDEKTKLAGIATGANKTTVDSALSASSTNPVQNKAINTALGNKVDKVTGKGLSTNDYTTDEKNKLAGIAANANNYSLPTASETVLGGVKLGEGLKISSKGVLSAVGVDMSGKTFITYDDDPDVGETVTARAGATVFNASYGGSTFSVSNRQNAGNMATGMFSTAMNYSNMALGQCSFAAGVGNVANTLQFVAGKYNANNLGATNADSQSDNDTIFTVGCGTTTIYKNAFRITAAGKCRGASSFGSSGADFAEYFEWKDGNPNNEDRRGKFVTLDGDKIRFATADDDYILGVVSGTGAFIGNSSSEEWQGKYLKDVFGEYIMQNVVVPEHTDEETGEVISEHTVEQFKVNPDYDPTEEYISREFRKEWSPVGLLGQVITVDNGTCQPNGYCMPSTNGVATASDNGYRVMKRIDNTHILVLVK